jgi:LPXTG-motif cell wall-anchored protein
MSADGIVESRTGLWTSVLSLFASSGTLVCCALPALLVTLGAGAALSSLVSVFPQIVWLSEHKEGLFVFAGLALAASGGLLWRNRKAPCPTDPVLRQACLHTRKTSQRVHLFSVLVYLVGAWFAFVQPWLSQA